MKTLLQWIGINGGLALLFTLIELQGKGDLGPGKFFLTLLVEFLNFQVISGLCYLTGRRFFALFPGISYNIRLLITLPPVLISAMVGIVILYGIVFLLGEPTVLYPQLPSFPDFFVGALPAVLVITVIITVIATRMEYLSSGKGEDEAGVPNPEPPLAKKKTSPRGGHAITVRVDEDYIPVAFPKIVYLSAHGGSTVIHTIDGEHVTNRLLKDFEEKLPGESFVRIHKSFIVNLKYIERIQYYSSGAYILFIKDEEASTLPVGRKYAPELKKRLSF